MAIKAQALHHQVADRMRRAIARGRWAPGTQIPTEAQLCATYGVSRPTVRLAVSALRTEGLLDVQQGRGTFVRAAREAVERTTVERAVAETASGFRICAPDWAEDTVEAPTITHVRIDRAAAALLHMPQGEAAFLTERLLAHSPSGTRARHTLLVPMEHAVGTPLAEPVPTDAADAYTALTAAHGPLEWHETVSARMPQPDERAALRAADVTPLLISQRVTRTQADGLPLMLETITLPADAAQLAFTLRPTRPAPRTPKG